MPFVTSRRVEESGGRVSIEVVAAISDKGEVDEDEGETNPWTRVVRGAWGYYMIQRAS